MIRRFKRNDLGILIDQDTNVRERVRPVLRPAGRLRRRAPPPTAVDLALRFRAPVVVGTCRRRGPRFADGHVVDAVEVPYDPDAPDPEQEAVRLTAACTAVLEAAIRQNPVEWVWMHERWKSAPRPTPDARTAGGGSQAKPVPKNAALSGG